jgi:hypothetical protein
MPTHTRKPGRPCAHSLGEKGKVLSPSNISFSKRGKKNTPWPSSLKKNKMEVTNLHGPVNPLHTHQMHMCSQRQVNALALIIFYDRLNNIIKQTYCCVLPKTNKQKKNLSLKKNGIKVAKRVTSSFGDPYKYAEYLEADHSSPQQQVPNIPFKDILVDDYFDDTNVSDGGGDSQGSDGEHQDFEFEDIVPFLEEEDNGDATLRHPAAGEE